MEANEGNILIVCYRYHRWLERGDFTDTFRTVPAINCTEFNLMITLTSNPIIQQIGKYDAIKRMILPSA